MAADISFQGVDPFRKVLLPGFWVLYTLFVVYGSLVPLSYRPLPLDEALLRFADIPYLSLDMYARQDWIANMVLYVPMGYFGCLLCKRMFSSSIAAALCSVVVCGAVAVGVEFAQLYFPDRTVSLNDLIAEGLGMFVGTAVFLFFGRRLLRIWRSFWSEGKNAIRAGLVLYALVFLLYTIFPFDFLISPEELLKKLDSEGYSLWMVATDEPLTVSTLRLIAKTVWVMPLGALVAVFTKRRMTVPLLLVVGGVVGSGIECLQFFLVSGISQGVSVVLTTLGFASGYATARRVTAANLPFCIAIMRRNGFSQLLWFSYLAVLVVANWGLRGPLVALGQVPGRLATYSFLPFYYHYYLPESRALFSAVGYVAMYVPVGVLLCLRGITHFEYIESAHLKRAMGTACFLAFGFELGKVFLERAKPDITNLLLGAVGAVLGCIVVYWTQRAWSLDLRKTLYRMAYH